MEAPCTYLTKYVDIIVNHLVFVAQVRCLTGSEVGYRSISPGFKSWLGYVWRVIHLSLCLISFGGHLAHFCDEVYLSTLNLTGLGKYFSNILLTYINLNCLIWSRLNLGIEFGSQGATPQENKFHKYRYELDSISQPGGMCCIALTTVALECHPKLRKEMSCKAFGNN